MKSIVFVLLVAFMSNPLNSQTIKGVVYDVYTNEKISGVHVYIDSKKGVSTNIKGKFKIKLNTKESQYGHIYFSHIGFKTLKLELSGLKEQNLVVKLEPKIRELEEAYINRSRTLRSKLNFEVLKSMDMPLYGFAAGIKDDKIYVVGGNNSIEANRVAEALRISFDRAPVQGSGTTMRGAHSMYAFFEQYNLTPRSSERFSDALMVYNLDDNTWETKDAEFRQRSSHNLHIHNDEMYVLGGEKSQGKKKYLDNIVEIYNAKSGSIKEDKTNPHEAVNFASFLYNNHIITLGGVKKIFKNGSKRYANDIHSYNLETGSWFKLGEMANPKEVKGILVDHRVYLIGGVSNRQLKSIESYNLESGEWTKEGELFSSTGRPALAHNGNIIFIYDKGKLTTFNVKTKVLNEYLIKLSVSSPEMFFHKDKLIIIGGLINKNYTIQPSKGVYSISIDEFSKTRLNKSKSLLWESS